MGRFDGYIIGSDFDGTLCIGGKVSERNLEAIRYFRGEGGHFGVVTGRNYGSTYPHVTRFVTDCYDFTVGLNGAFGALPDGEFFFEEHGDIHNVIPLYEYLRSCEDAVWVGCAVGKEFYFLGEDEDKTPPQSLIGGGIFNQVNVPCVSDEAAQIICGQIRERFCAYFNPLQNGGTIDIPPAGVSKATGILRAAEYFGISAENIFTVGDNYNDLDMIRAFNGCAVENAVDSVKAAAECTVPDVAGVIEYIEKSRAL